MAEHPYKSQPAHAFWSRAIRDTPPGEVDPVVQGAFTISPRDKVATAGSCFAQHIARYLSASGFHYLVTETPHPILPAHLVKEYDYNTFTARYGNIYTTGQLNQLFDRAYGEFSPVEQIWRTDDERFIDPFRPNIQPGGFASAQEFSHSRDLHLRAVREMFETLDVFVFTLGLTECWRAKGDGAVFPICPGVMGGEFDAARHEFHNMGVDEVVRDLRAFWTRLSGVNPRARIILTVSPVPLAATAEDRHVLQSTTVSKSILRVAADQITRELPAFAYFPSYEIITGTFSRGGYFADDCRSVLEDGVAHVMGLFMRHYTDSAAAPPLPDRRAERRRKRSQLRTMQRLVEVNCEEAALDRG